jgi:hypothetical protein
MTSDAEIYALAWLDRAILYEEAKRFGSPESDRHRATVKAMLAAPRMPEPDAVSEDALQAMRDAWDHDGWHTAGRAVYRALYAHLTAKPDYYTTVGGMPALRAMLQWQFSMPLERYRGD